MRTCCVNMGQTVSATYPTPYCLRRTASVYSVHSRPRNTPEAVPIGPKPSLHRHADLTYTMTCCLKVARSFLRRVRLQLRATDNTCLLGPKAAAQHPVSHECSRQSKTVTKEFRWTPTSVPESSYMAEPVDNEALDTESMAWKPREPQL